MKKDKKPKEKGQKIEDHGGGGSDNNKANAVQNIRNDFDRERLKDKMEGKGSLPQEHKNSEKRWKQ